MALLSRACCDNVTEPNRKHARYVRDLDIGDEWNDIVYNKVKELWLDQAIQDEFNSNTKTRTLIKSQCIQLKYLMKKENLDRYGDDHFVPTSSDILRCRIRTTGHNTAYIKIDNAYWCLTDVGGQTTERHKWPEIVTQDTNVVVYFVSLNEYDTPSSEDPTKSNLDMSLSVFSELVNSDYMKEMYFVVFFNKFDLFKKQIKSKKSFTIFQDLYPEYKGNQSPEEAGKFILEKFQQVIVDEAKKVEFYAKFICAIDTKMMSVVFSGFRNHIFRKRVELSGLKMV
eukprot:TRINITY_DN1305_c0_g2_i2.p1 TRINITY_DN1305_c0_g2~~TRINITY_DN1305_c0_g2_i2.p1  ORF type:complete len:283 (-),score=19.73 TRINITY_DN1305_c0_g2_i2:20-868(-)